MLAERRPVWQSILLDFAERAAASRVQIFAMTFLDDDISPLLSVTYFPGYWATLNPPLKTLGKIALDAGATQAVCCYYRPRGLAKPTECEAKKVREMALAFRPIGVTLLDFVIYTPNDVFAYRARGLL